MELGALGEPGMLAQHLVMGEHIYGPGLVTSPVQPMVAYSAQQSRPTLMFVTHTLAQVLDFENI